MGQGSRVAPGAALALALLLWILVYRETLAGIVATWHSNSTFSHGLLIVPISLWLAWRKRHELSGIAWSPSWLGFLAVTACTLLWVVGRGVGVIGIEQFAVVAMVPGLVLALGGWRLTGRLAMPLGYLMLAVPVGVALIPWLMQLTADLATLALRATGVPTLRSHMYITVPAGNFEVARACSGLNYTLTGVALGALYTYLSFAGWRKRLLSMLAFVVVPIVANGVRVYITILVSQLTDMRFGPGEEHVWFGRVFFILLMLAMFWVGRRWADADMPVAVATASQVAVPRGARAWLPAIAALLVLITGPVQIAAATGRVEARLALEADHLQLMEGAQGWSGPVTGTAGWRPLYSGARAEQAGVYRESGGGTVDIYVGVYGIGNVGGSEMINYSNRIFANENKSLSEVRRRELSLDAGRHLTLRELRVTDGGPERLVWYWYLVGERPLTSPYWVKAHEALAFLTMGAVTERIITLSTVVDGGEVERLERFLSVHADCLAAGLAFEECGG